MTARRMLRGTDLRYVLTMYLAQHGPATVPELIDMLDGYGFAVSGRPSKTISDALRWEIGHNRVWPYGRGRYRFAEMPRSTEYRIRHRVLALRAEARELAELSLPGGQQCHRPGDEAA